MLQTLFFLTSLPTRQDGVENRDKVWSIKPGFLMSGKSQTIGDFNLSRLSQISVLTNENSKS